MGSTFVLLTWHEPIDDGGESIDEYTAYGRSSSPLFYVALSQRVLSILNASQRHSLETMVSSILSRESSRVTEGADLDSAPISVASSWNNLSYPLWKGPGEQLSVNITFLPPGAAVSFFITAGNSVGEGKSSAVASVTTPTNGKENGLKHDFIHERPFSCYISSVYHFPSPPHPLIRSFSLFLFPISCFSFPKVPLAPPPPTIGKLFWRDGAPHVPVYWKEGDFLTDGMKKKKSTTEQRLANRYFVGGLPIEEYELQIDGGFPSDDYFPNRDQRGQFFAAGRVKDA